MATAYIVLAMVAFMGLILVQHCWPKWTFNLVWTGGRLRRLHYKPRVASGGGSHDSSGAGEEQVGVTEEDLKLLLAYIDEKDGGPPWQLITDRATSTLSFRVWRRDPKFGPTQYRSQTIFENMEPELLRDFFWDDGVRTKWDDMLVSFRTIHEYPRTGTVIIHWIRKFPFFYSYREYIIARRMWVSGSTYYCVTKSIPYPGIPSGQRTRRADLYYSSWRIREVESRNGVNSTACEVLLFHFEDMGIQKMLAKIGFQRVISQLLEKLERGVRSYQMSRLNGAPPSRYAQLARISTQIPRNFPLDGTNLPENEFIEDEAGDFAISGNTLKWLLAGGILISCGLKWLELGKGNICNSKGDQEVSFFPGHEEIVKQVQELGGSSKSLEELIQKGKSLASSQILREQNPVSQLVARVSQLRRWRKGPWPRLFTAAMRKIFGW